MKLKQAIITVLMVLIYQNLAAIGNEGTFLANHSRPSNTNYNPIKVEFDWKIPVNPNLYFQFIEERALKIRINRGRKFTNKREIEVEIRPIKLSATLVSKMKVGFQPDLSDAEWEPFKFNKFLTIPDQEGEIVVYATLRDKAGNDAPIEKARIIVDTTPPQDLSLVINKGAEFTSDPEMKVRLSIHAKDAYKMQLSNSLNFTNATWEDFVPEKNWFVGPRAEGKKTVYVRFADKAANVSEPTEASIYFDITPPKGTVELVKGQKLTNSRTIELKIKSPDAAVVRIVGPGIKNVPYNKTEDDGSMIKKWELDSTDGQKFIKVFFRDNAGNINKTPAIAEVYLDTKAPNIGLFRINNGEKYVTNQEGKVSLKIGTREPVGSFKMYISNYADFKDAKVMDYQPKVDKWQLLTDEDGIKKVYLKFVDKANNTSKIAVARVMLDRSVPQPKTLVIENGVEWVNKNYASLSLSAEGADFMEVSNSPKFSQTNTWEPYKSQRRNWVLPVRDGKIEVYARFKDKAGNISEVISNTIKKDTKAPKGMVAINNNARFTSDKNKQINLKLSYDKDVKEMQINNAPSFNGMSWQPASSELKSWQLDGEDGEKRVFVRYKDNAGNISDIIAAGITLDRIPPQYPSVIINGDSMFTVKADKMVDLEISAEDAYYMMVSADPNFKDAKWLPIAEKRAFMLQGGDGKKEIFVKFKDMAGNVSSVASDEIILDRYPPKAIAFKIDNGNEWSNNRNKKVALQIKAEGAVEMLIADNPDFNGAKWQSYAQELKDFVLTGEDGEKTLYVMFKDEAGHHSASLSATIKLKREF